MTLSEIQSVLKISDEEFEPVLEKVWDDSILSLSSNWSVIDNSRVIENDEFEGEVERLDVDKIEWLNV